jgi:hypothetical protein
VKDKGVGFTVQNADARIQTVQRSLGEAVLAPRDGRLAICQRIVHRHGEAIWPEDAATA